MLYDKNKKKVVENLLFYTRYVLQYCYICIYTMYEKTL